LEILILMVNKKIVMNPGDYFLVKTIEKN